MERYSNICEVREQKKKSAEQYMGNVWKKTKKKNCSYLYEWESGHAARRTYFPYLIFHFKPLCVVLI